MTAREDPYDYFTWDCQRCGATCTPRESLLCTTCEEEVEKEGY